MSRRSLFTLFLEPNPGHEIGESFGRCHSEMLINDRDIGVIKFGHEEREVETTYAYHPSECLKTR